MGIPAAQISECEALYDAMTRSHPFRGLVNLHRRSLYVACTLRRASLRSPPLDPALLPPSCYFRLVICVLSCAHHTALRAATGGLKRPGFRFSAHVHRPLAGAVWRASLPLPPPSPRVFALRTRNRRVKVSGHNPASP